MSLYLEDSETEKQEDVDSQEALYLFGEGSDFISSKFCDFLISGAEAVDYCERLNISKNLLSRKCLQSLERKKLLKEEEFNKIDFKVDCGVLLNLKSCTSKTSEENLDNHCFSQSSFSETFYKKLNLSNDKIREVLTYDSGLTGPFQYFLDTDDTKDYYTEKRNNVDEFFTEINELCTMLVEEESEEEDEPIIKTQKEILPVVTCSYETNDTVYKNDSDSSYEKSMELLRLEQNIDIVPDVMVKPILTSRGEKWKRSQKGKKKYSKYKGEQSKNNEQLLTSHKKKNVPSSGEKSKITHLPQSTDDKKYPREKHESSTHLKVKPVNSVRDCEDIDELLKKAFDFSKSGSSKQCQAKIDCEKNNMKNNISDSSDEAPLVKTSKASSSTRVKKQVKSIKNDPSADDLFEKSLGAKSFRAKIALKK